MSDRMTIDLSWLKGRSIRSVEKKDFTWFFVFDDTVRILTEAHWRLVGKTIVVTSEDHDQLFGLSTPVNAADVASNSVGSSSVVGSDVDARTGDLSLHFENGVTIQFVTVSAGYEGWRIRYGGQEIICLGGGEIVTFGAP